MEVTTVVNWMLIKMCARSRLRSAYFNTGPVGTIGMSAIISQKYFYGQPIFLCFRDSTGQVTVLRISFGVIAIIFVVIVIVAIEACITLSLPRAFLEID
jgi:hypothetical protein